MAERALAPLRAVERFVFAPEDARRLAGMRIALFGMLALRLATNGGYADVAGQPHALFDPVSLFHLLSGMPSPGLTAAVQVAGVVAALLAAAGAWPRVSFPAAFACALFLNLMLNATGKIVHNDLVLTLCLIPLLAVPVAASRVWALPGQWRARRPAMPSGRRLIDVAYGWPIRAAMIIVGLAYLFAGLQKLRYSGIDWVTTDNLRYVLWSASDSHAGPNQLALFIAGHDWMAHAFAAASLLTELGFILCLPFARLRRLLVPAVVGLHVGIWLSMGLNYFPQVWAVIAVFVDWAWLADARRSRRAAAPAPTAADAAASS